MTDSLITLKNVMTSEEPTPTKLFNHNAKNKEDMDQVINDKIMKWLHTQPKREQT